MKLIELKKIFKTNGSHEVLDYLFTHKNVNWKEISSRIDISPSTLSRTIKYLHDNGIIIKKTTGKHVEYTINKRYHNLIEVIYNARV